MMLVLCRWNLKVLRVKILQYVAFNEPTYLKRDIPVGEDEEPEWKTTRRMSCSGACATFMTEGGEGFAISKQLVCGAA